MQSSNTPKSFPGKAYKLTDPPNPAASASVAQDSSDPIVQPVSVKIPKTNN